MSDLPLELIDHILTFVDASSLYELGHVSHTLFYLSQKQIYQHHIQYASIRLWMHQPGTMIHKPIGFELDTTTPTAIGFTYTGEPIPFDPTKPISVDGCTVIFDHHQHHPGLNQPSATKKKHYGITYDDEPIVMNKVDFTWTMEKQDQWSMYGELDQEEGRFQPMGLSCDVNLFNPDLLDTLLQQQTTRLKERIQLKKQQQQKMTRSGGGGTTPLFGGGGGGGLASPLKDASYTPKSLTSSPPSKHFTSLPFSSISS